MMNKMLFIKSKIKYKKKSFPLSLDAPLSITLSIYANTPTQIQQNASKHIYLISA